MEIVLKIDWGSFLMGIGFGWLFLFFVALLVSARQVAKQRKDLKKPPVFPKNPKK